MKRAIFFVFIMTACAHRNAQHEHTAATGAGKTTSSDQRSMARGWDGALAPGGVARIQDALADRGYLEHDQRTGTADQPTRDAIRNFQKSQHLSVTGVPDQETVSALGLDQREVFRSSGYGEPDYRLR